MIELITGPMYSGKSMMLYQKMERYTYAHKKVALVRPYKDSRSYFSHSPVDIGLKKLCDTGMIEVLSTNKFDEEFVSLLASYAAVFVDEYFMIENCAALVSNIGAFQDVYFAGLLATSECKMFDEAIAILPFCDSIVKLNGVCTQCGSQLGNYSYYKLGNKTQAVVVGDTDYTCLCRSCYKKSIEKSGIKCSLISSED